MDPERAHNYGVKLAKYKIVPYDRNETDPVLHSTVWGLDFKNPVCNNYSDYYSHIFINIESYYNITIAAGYFIDWFGCWF